MQYKYPNLCYKICRECWLEIRKVKGRARPAKGQDSKNSYFSQFISKAVDLNLTKQLLNFNFNPEERSIFNYYLRIHHQPKLEAYQMKNSILGIFNGYRS